MLAGRPEPAQVVTPGTLATWLPEDGVKPLVVLRNTLYDAIVQFVGGVTAVQLSIMVLDDVAVAVKPVGAAGDVVHEGEPPPPPLSGNWMLASIDCFCALAGVAS